VAVDLIVLGQATVDHVVPAAPGAWREQIGGNGLYAAAGARLWLDPARIAVVGRVGRGFPLDLDRLLARAGIAHRAITAVDVEHLVEWVLYEADGTRRSLPRNEDLRDASGEGTVASEAYLSRLQALSPSVEDLPKEWLPARAAHLSPQVAERHHAAVARLKGRVDFLSVDPSPHYSASLSTGELGQMLSGATALLPSEQELRHLAGNGENWADIVASLRGAGFAEVVVKRGARGALLSWDAHEPEIIPAVPIVPRDPTGAGDAFCGAYAACRAQDLPPPEAARRAAVAGAMVVACAGAEAALGLSPSEAVRHLERIA
jgi:ribokinase